MFSSKDLFFTTPAGGYRIAKSLRFRASASAYLNRTFSTPTSATIWTFSAWVKRGALTGTYRLFGASTTTYLTFNSSDQINLTLNGTSAATSTAVFRDPSAWYHVVYQQNGSAQTIWVNNQSVATGTTAAAVFNTAIVHQIGAANTTNYFDGYLADVNFIDGQALTPSSFGETDATTGVWKPKAYTGTYGTNGFYLKFTTVGATSGSNTGYGQDFSGNGNYWTTNNFGTTSTATTYDSMIDTPTPYDDGGNGVGNYAVINPLDSFASGGVTISGANLNVSLDRTTYENWARASFTIPPSGKWYFEWTPTAVNTGTTPYFNGGVISAATTRATQWTSGIYRGITVHNGNKVSPAGSATYGAATTTIPGTDYFMCALDMDSGNIYFGKNGSWANGTGSFNQTFSTATSAYTDLVSSGVTWMPFVFHGGQTTNTGSINFGQRPFGATPPSGFKALNTQNLPTPTIAAGGNYMLAVLYNGTSASNTVVPTTSNSGNNPLALTFQPDLVWIKSRSAATNHEWTDAVRGVTKSLVSNSTAAEATDTNGLTAFTSTGFTVGSDSNYNNGTGPATYVAWQWKGANGTVSNTSGSITSTVSANTTAGFSVVTYTGTLTGTPGTCPTVGHGLGVAPSLVISKSRNVTGVDSGAWFVWSANTGSTDNYLRLNTTAAVASVTGGGGGTMVAPTSTVFSTPYVSGANINANNYVAYCFAAVAGYSAFGSYTGNGSADGPFVFTGFRPRYILVKRTDAASTIGWFVWDTSRETANGLSGNYQLYPNTSGAEANNGTDPDILSNGFKLRGAYADFNASGGTYIYAAFAENPFKYALAR